MKKIIAALVSVLAMVLASGANFTWL